MAPSEEPVQPVRMRRFALVLLALAAVPDVLPYAGLKTVIGERFQVGDAQTQLFALAALLGALFAVPLLARTRRASPRAIFALAAITQAIVIASMAFPIDWWLLLVLRGIQGGADLLLLAILVTLVASSGRATGRGFGAAGAAIMIGLALGLIAGGVLAANAATVIFPAATVVSLGLAVASWGLPMAPLAASGSRTSALRDRRIVAGGAFAASDRMISGMLTASLPLLLVAAYGTSSTMIGIVLAAPLLACAIGGYASGAFVDRVGALPVRLLGVPLQVLGVAMIIFSNGTMSMLVVGALVLALGAALLLPTSLVIGAGLRPKDVGADAVGGIHAIGQAGHLIGVVLVIGSTAYLGEVTASAVVAILAAYLVWNGIWLLRARALASMSMVDVGGIAQERLKRRAVGPISVRARRPRTKGLIEPVGEVHSGSFPEELIEEPTPCPSTNTNALKTTKS